MTALFEPQWEEDWKVRAKCPDDTAPAMCSVGDFAFALVLFKNNYFAWLLEAKTRFGNLVTDYDEHDGEVKSLLEHALQGVLLSPTEDGEFSVLTPDTSGGEGQSLEYNEAKELFHNAIEELRSAARDNQEYKDMLVSLESVAEEQDEDTRKKKKRRVLQEMKIYTARRGSEKAFRGWSLRDSKDIAALQVLHRADWDNHVRFSKAYRTIFVMMNKKGACGDPKDVDDAPLLTEAEMNELYNMTEV